MKLTIDLPDALVAAIADAVAERLTTRGQDADALIGADQLGIPRRTWRRAIHDGELVGVKIGREWMARRSDVDRWLEGLAVQPATAPAPAWTETDDDQDDDIEKLIAAGRLRVLPGGGR